MDRFLRPLALILLLSACAPSSSRQGATAQPAAKIIAGRVTRAADGSPVAGAKVYMKLTPPAVTDADGRFELRHDLDGYRSVWVVAAGLAMDRQKINVAGKARVDGVDFRLEPSLRVTGRIVSEQGDVVAGARVYVFAREWPESETRTDKAGRFILDTLYEPADAWLIVEADGFAPAVLKTPDTELGDVTMHGEPTGVLAGRVVGANGKPWAGAHIYLQPRNAGHADDCQQSAVTDANGAFRFVVARGRYDVVAIASDQSQAALLRDVSVSDNESVTALVLEPKPWLRLAGQIDSSQPAAYAGMEVAAYPLDLGTRVYYMLSDSNPVDSAGRFELSRLLPGRYRVNLYSPPHVNEPLLSRFVEVTDQTTELTLGRKFPGIVRGELLGLGQQDGPVAVELQRLPNSEPASPAEETSPATWQRTAHADAAGQFEFVDVPPGPYQLALFENAANGDILQAHTNIVVRAHAPVVAKLAVERIATVKPRQAAPDFELTDADGKLLRLSNLAGKFVFLDFWATWCLPCRRELPYLKELATRFGARDDFVLVSISLDEDETHWRDFIRKQQMNWRHALDKPGSPDAVARRYGVMAIPSTFLIGSDGTVLKTDLRGPKMVTGVAAALPGD
jgi:peroxiredoxin/protocatechuate 3,4-dioxygenase beta subunit